MLSNHLGVFLRRGNLDIGLTHTEGRGRGDSWGGNGHVTTEAETGDPLLRARECPGPPDVEEAQEDPPLEPPDGAWAQQHLNSRLLASRTMRDENAAVLSAPFRGSLLGELQEPTQGMTELHWGVLGVGSWEPGGHGRTDLASEREGRPGSPSV